MCKNSLHRIFNEFCRLLFINLLKKSLDDLAEKQYHTFVQKVTLDDWNSFLKNNTKWQIIYQYDIYNTVDIKCSLDDALYNICQGLGLN